MNRVRSRALVLAAGFGTRLHPLTYFLPKPLLPVCGLPVIGHTLRELAKIDAEASVVNLHYFPEEMESSLGSSFFAMPLLYSREKEIQGTKGALYPPREFLVGADAIFVINGDSLCEWPLRAMLRRHLKSDADVTLLLLRNSPDPSLGGGVGVNRGGEVVSLRNSEPIDKISSTHTFAGVHILSPRVIKRVTEGPGDIIEDLYIPLLADGGKIQSFVTSKAWHDLGTPNRYLEACLQWGLGRSKIPLKRSWQSPLAEVAQEENLEFSMVEAEVRVEEGARVKESILLTGAHIGEGSQVQGSIVGPGVHLPAASKIESCMVNRADSRYRAKPQESVIGELIYTRLE